MLQTVQIVARISKELSKATGISVDQAKKVLSVLHFEKLIDNLNNSEKALKDRVTARALGFGESEASDVLTSVTNLKLNLANLRVSVKKGAVRVLKPSA